MKCLVCHEEITPEEISQMSAEFKLYPAHQDCFDSFDSADEFLAFAKSELSKEAPAPSIEKQIDL